MPKILHKDRKIILSNGDFTWISLCGYLDFEGRRGKGLAPYDAAVTCKNCLKQMSCQPVSVQVIDEADMTMLRDPRLNHEWSDIWPPIPTRKAMRLTCPEIRTLSNWCGLQFKVNWKPIEMQEILDLYQIVTESGFENWEIWYKKKPGMAVKIWNNIMRPENQIVKVMSSDGRWAWRNWQK